MTQVQRSWKATSGGVCEYINEKLLIIYSEGLTSPIDIKAVVGLVEIAYQKGKEDKAREVRLVLEIL